MPAYVPNTSPHKNTSPLPPCKGFATDGIRLYYQPSVLCTLFLEDPSGLRRSYLHVHLHCICLHMVQSIQVPQELWDRACDLSVELLSELLHKTPESRCLTELLIRHLEMLAPNADVPPLLSLLRKDGWLPPAALLPLLPSDPQLQSLAASCELDDHSFWSRDLVSALSDCHKYRSDSSCGGEGIKGPHLSHNRLTQLEELQRCWNTQLPRVHQAIRSGQRSGKAGIVSEDADLQQQDSQDYRKFLRQFAVPGEETILDMESFDYIPYYYGLACYAQEITNFQSHIREITDLKQNAGDTVSGPIQNKPENLLLSSLPEQLPFIEPLEYTEVNRLDELAIAIDTSGSCSGRIVRRFLEETWSILRQRENFFSKMRLHLIQCDCMIQEHRIFTSVEEWEAALSDIKILGHGNTNFQPVFEYLENLIAKKEIRRLRGLLYFTDGDGIFPSRAPAWDTAFVFLNQQTEKHAVPDWAIRLNLHLPEEF